MSTLSLLAVSFGLLILVVGAMTIGLWFGRRPIAGTCGGLAKMQGESCSICGGKPDNCKSGGEEAAKAIED